MVELIEKPIDVAAVLAACGAAEAGAVSLFLGTVRNHHAGHRVDHLEYEAYPPLALKTMQAIAATASSRWPLSAVALVHRLGRLTVGEVSVAVAVSSPHRAQAFEACRFIIDTVKEEVPLGKKEVGPDGQVWIEGDDLRPARS